MGNKGNPLQDPFLNTLRRERVPVSVYLVNGIKLQGHIESFDQHTFVLVNTTKQMVYKHAVSTVVPGRRVKVTTEGTNDEPVNTQDIFLNVLKEAGKEVDVYLVSGIKLHGVITRFDQFTFVLDGERTVQLVYKHSVSTVVVQK